MAEIIFSGGNSTPRDAGADITALGAPELNLTAVREVEAPTITAGASVSLSSHARVSFTGTGPITESVGGAIVEQFPVELRLLSPFPYPALEECRQRTLRAVTIFPDTTAQSRGVLVFAYATELRSVFVELLNAPVEKVIVAIPGRQKTLDIDADLQILQMRKPQFMREMEQLRVPQAYRDVIETHYTSASFTHRVSAMCAMLVLVAALLLDDEAHA